MNLRKSFQNARVGFARHTLISRLISPHFGFINLLIFLFKRWHGLDTECPELNALILNFGYFILDKIICNFRTSSSLQLTTLLVFKLGFGIGDTS